MKRILKQLGLILLAVCIPLPLMYAQTKKSEEKIKIVVADKDGERTVLDTTILNASKTDTIMLKNGKVIYIAKPEDAILSLKDGDRKGTIHVTTRIENEDGEKTGEKIIVISGDGANWTAASSAGEAKHIYAYAATGDEGDETGKHIIVKTGKGKDLVWEEKDGKTVHITMDSDTDSDRDNDMTKYVIAKNGVVVTIESDDEVKAKEIIDLIESKLDVKTEKPAKKK
ncbi:MAG: hypothetical protein MUE74_03480 [Bacteroidales bacterium]|jgi:hypothetical protein|nr:hypothetical protein [Bacteroidales bacterium]